MSSIAFASGYPKSPAAGQISALGTYTVDAGYSVMAIILSCRDQNPPYDSKVSQAGWKDGNWGSVADPTMPLVVSGLHGGHDYNVQPVMCVYDTHGMIHLVTCDPVKINVL